MKKSFTDIDLGNLEWEWVRQPKLYGRYSSKMADAKLDLAEAVAELEVQEALVKRAIRRNPKKFGVDKITEGSVKEAMILSLKYRKAVKNVDNHKHTVDVISGLLTTLEHRKRTLEGLVSLLGQSYFAKPTLPKNVDDRKLRQSIDIAEKRSIRRKGLKRK